MSALKPTSEISSNHPSAAVVLPKATLDLSIVIVNYNVKEFLEQALISVQKALTNISSEIIVVDNASGDGSVGMLQKQFPEVKLIINSRNLGFAKSSNIGISYSCGKWIVLLNPDTIVREDTFSKTLDFFSHHDDTGMLGCKILNPDGTLQLACRRSFPTPWVAFTKLSGLSRIFAKSRLFGRYNLTYLDPDKIYEVEAISGSFMAVRRETIMQVGLLDESFFMYGEDLDWCFRVRQGKWKVMYFPGIQIIHFKGESSKKAQFDSLRTFYKAMELFAHKHFKHSSILTPFWILLVAIWLRAGISFFANFLKSIIVPLADLFILSGSVVLGVYLRFGNLDTLGSYVPVLIAYTIVWMVALKICGAHNRSKLSSSQAGFAILIGFLFNTSLTFFFKQYAFSRAVVLFSSAFILLVVPGWRLLFKVLPRLGLISFQGTLGKSLLARKTIIVGEVKSASTLIHKLCSQIDSGYDIKGFVSTNGEHTGKFVAGIKVLGDVGELNTLITERNIQEVIFAAQQLSYDRILDIISRSGEHRVNYKLIPSNYDVIIGKASIDRLDDVPLVELDYKLHQKPYRLIKRFFDILLAFNLFSCSLPLFLYMKYLSSHRLIKRRLMGANGEFIVREFIDAGTVFLRKLPYLWSVLVGDMSFVGSEIYEIESSDQAEFGQTIRLKPGLTGLVQVNTGKNLTVEDKQKYEIYYLKNYSVILDLEIIFKALFRITSVRLKVE